MILFRVQHKETGYGPFTTAREYATGKAHNVHYNLSCWLEKSIRHYGLNFPVVRPSDAFYQKVRNLESTYLYAFIDIPNLIEAFGPGLKKMERLGYELCVISVPDEYCEQKKGQVMYVEKVSHHLFSMSLSPPYPFSPIIQAQIPSIYGAVANVQDRVSSRKKLRWKDTKIDYSTDSDSESDNE